MIKGAKLVVDNLGVNIDGHCIVDGVNFLCPTRRCCGNSWSEWEW